MHRKGGEAAIAGPSRRAELNERRLLAGGEDRGCGFLLFLGQAGFHHPVQLILASVFLGHQPAHVLPVRPT